MIQALRKKCLGMPIHNYLRISITLTVTKQQHLTNRLLSNVFSNLSSVTT
jgi:hypothetical protein